MSIQNVSYVLLLAFGGFAVSQSSGQIIYPSVGSPMLPAPAEDLVGEHPRLADSTQAEVCPVDSSGFDGAQVAGGDVTEQKARCAARVDPGILWYVEPPSGTDMPTITPPKLVDPDMLWRPWPESTATIPPEKN